MDHRTNTSYQNQCLVRGKWQLCISMFNVKGRLEKTGPSCWGLGLTTDYHGLKLEVISTSFWGKKGSETRLLDNKITHGTF